ncbi:type II secretion system F family protein [Gleimia coleocanis]|uniref:type II secretion system F family protein n=1 Tax=Gleimia coleocanis TaxID=103618 RepID=UPI0002FE7D7D|nr:type II secretion system F family protein [Gleimia coleocanis]
MGEETKSQALQMNLPIVPAYVVAAVVAYLRCGMSVPQAWEQACEDLQVGVDAEEVLNQPEFAQVASSIRAAGKVSAEIGVGLADALEAIVGSLEEAEENAKSLEVAFASTQATVRLLAALPAVGLGLAWLLGADLPAFITGTFWGWLVAVAGGGLWVAGFVWVRRLVAKFHEQKRENVDPVVAVRLFAACLVAGLAVPRSLEVIAAGCGYPNLAVVSRLFLLGADSSEVTEFLSSVAASDVVTTHLGLAILTAWMRGSDPLATLELVVQRLRRERLLGVQVEIQKLGVWLALPLGLCFLPAFVLLGVVPVAWLLFLS